MKAAEILKKTLGRYVGMSHQPFTMIELTIVDLKKGWSGEEQEGRDQCIYQTWD